MQPEWDKFTPNFPIQYENNNYKTYDAMLAKRTDTGESFILIGIEGFDFEEEYEYVLEIKKKIESELYNIMYQLIEITDKK